MGQILVRNVSDRALLSLRSRAKHKGTSLEQEARELLESRAALTPAEKLAVSRHLRSQTQGVATPLTLDEIREGRE